MPKTLVPFALPAFSSPRLSSSIPIPIPFRRIINFHPFARCVFVHIKGGHFVVVAPSDQLLPELIISLSCFGPLPRVLIASLGEFNRRSLTHTKRPNRLPTPANCKCKLH